MQARIAVASFLVAALLVAGLVRTSEAADPPWAKVSPAQVAAAKKLGVPVAFENSIGIRFVLIPPGTFQMGSRDSAARVAGLCNMSHAQAGWFLDEHPRHEETLEKAFYLAIHEVTREQHKALFPPKPPSPKAKGKDKDKDKKNTEPPPPPEDPRTPVEASWSDAEKFYKDLSRRDKREYSLPTEAQWEYACRAGTAGPFAFGETISTDQANYHGDYTYGKGKKGTYRGKPLPAGSLAANAWGLYDMHGNVSEWCADHYGEYYSSAESKPATPPKGSERVLRGGSWRSYPGACRSAFRHRREAGARGDTIGFRICCSVAAGPAPK